MTAILVTGASGTLGKAVLAEFAARRIPVRALSRQNMPTGRAGAEWVRGDLLSGQGLAQVFGGIKTVLHLATNPEQPMEDLQAARQLALAARAAGTEHLLYMSIAGIEQMQDFAYYRVKLGVEQYLAASGLPYSIQRATQFHELIALIARRLTLGPVTMIPSGPTLQPLGALAAARQMVGAALNPPAGRLPDLAGPEVRRLESLLAAYCRARHLRPLRLPFPLLAEPLQSWRRERGRAAVPGRAVRVGNTWESWLTGCAALP